MKTIDNEEIGKWISINFPSFNKEIFFQKDNSGKLEYSIPLDSGKKIVLGNVVSSFFNNEAESLLWINEFGIWPSGEDWNLFDGFRKSFGEEKSVAEKPGHLFNKDDIENIRSLINIILCFYWGAWIISKNIIVNISHDEIIEIHINNSELNSLEFKRKIEKILKV